MPKRTQSSGVNNQGGRKINLRDSMIPNDFIRLQQRRTFLGQITRGVGAVALVSLLNPDMLCGGGQEKLPVFRARGKANSFIEAGQPMPQFANRQTEIAACAHIVSGA